MKKIKRIDRIFFWAVGIISTFLFAITLAWAADTALTALAELSAAPDGTDVVYIADGGVSKKITVTNLLKLVQTVEDTTPQLGGNLDGQDKILSAIEISDYSESTGTATVSSGVLTVDVTNGNIQAHTLSENVTQIDFTNIPAAKVTTITLVLTQHASAAKTVIFTVMEINSVSKSDFWSGAVPPTMSSGVGDIDLYTFVIDPANNQIFAFVGGQNFG